jgi:hypothetical protein
MQKVSSQERVFEIVRQLCGSHVAGLTNKELAGRIGTSETNICRDMALFKKNEWVVQGSGSRWRLSPTFAGLAGRVMRAYQEARLRLTEEEARYASEMQ